MTLGDKGPTVIVGAGLAGTLLAINLAHRGYDIVMYESRPDLRRVDIDSGRSINLALATRGIVPLISAGLIDQVDPITIPMRGRMIHTDDKPNPELLPYGSRRHEVIHSVSRTDLTGLLLNAAEATGRVSVEFNAQVESVDLATSTLHFVDGATAPFGVVFGADGAGSRVRKAIAAAGSCTFETEWLDHDYKELTLPAGSDGRHQLDPNALHIWPRGEFMLIALANPGGDFTITFFAPKETFSALTDTSTIDAFFEEHFTDFAARVPDLAEQFLSNPTGRLGTMYADGWSHEGRAVLVGDAAHAIVPFHGQGMNASLESVKILARHVRSSPEDLDAAFRAFEFERKPDADAIAEMALQNYLEMRAGVVDPEYLAKRELALELERRHPEYLSPRYNMVMFSTMPYAAARQRARDQAEIIAAALADDGVDVDSLVRALEPLPTADPLNEPDALSNS